MPSMVGQALPRVSQLVVDADLIMPTGYIIKTEAVQELAGRTVSFRSSSGTNILTVDGTGVRIRSAIPLYVDSIYERTAGSIVTFVNGLKTNSINDGGGGLINILQSCQLAATKYLAAPTLMGDVIEDQAGTGAAPFPLGIETDDINEYTASHGIDINDPVTLDALVTKLTQMYRTGAPSNTQRDIDATEVTIAEPPVGHTILKGSITIPDNYTGSANGIRLKVTAKKTNAGGIVALRAYINAVDQGAWSNITNSYAEYSTDLSGVAPGDVLTVYCYSSVAGGGNVSAKDLKACCDDTIAHVMGSLTW